MGEGQNGELDLRFGRYGARVQGSTVVMIVVLALSLGTLVYIDLLGQRDRKREHEDMAREISILTWINSLPQAERPRLVMPPGVEGRLAPRHQSYRGDQDR